MATPAVFGRGFQDLEQLNLSPEVSFVEFLVEDGFVNAMQFSQAELLREQLKADGGVLQIVTKSASRCLILREVK